MPSFNESSVNAVENVAYRVAQRRGGVLSPHHILPYLPISLAMAAECLDNMVDGSAVTREVRNHIIEYHFAAYGESANAVGVLSVDTCVACDKDQPGSEGGLICPACELSFRKDLNCLAEQTGWPAEAVYQHEILYHTAGEGRAFHVDNIAGASRYTLRSIRHKLRNMVEHDFAAEDIDSTGLPTYRFPDLVYPRAMYQRNMAVIRSYPSSIMEEVQGRVVRILFTLGFIFLLMLLLAFWGVPFPMLVVFFVVTAPIVSLLMWRHRKKVDEKAV